MHRLVRRVATARPLNDLGGALVRRLLAGRSAAEIERRALLARAVRFPIRARFAEVELVEGITAFVHPPAAPHLYWAGPRAMEPEVVPTFVRLAKDARTVVDVGASFGFYSLLAHRLNPEARVLAFEPNPQTAALLAETLARNGAAVELHELALSDRECTAELSLAGGLSSLVGGRWPAGAARALVRCARFDDVVTGPVDLVKIDAEGAEPLVLAGMERTLAESRPAVICEVAAENVRRVGELAAAQRYAMLALGDGENFLLEPQEWPGVRPG